MKDNKFSLISSILFLILGLILFIKPDTVIKSISYIMGGILIIIGLYKCFNYYIQDKRLQVVNHNELAFGVTAIVLGIVFICLASAIELLLRLFIGIWLIIAGLRRVALTFYTTNRDSKFYALIIVGLILIALGLYVVLVSNLALQIMGLFMVLYSIIDIISIFVYKNSFVKEETKLEKDLIKSAKVIEGEAVEVKEEIEEEAKEVVKKVNKKDKSKKKS